MEPQDRKTGRETPPRSRTTQNRRVAMRMIRDPLQGMVLVYQLEPTAQDHRPPALVMETGEWCVKLEDFPANWRELKDDELLKLRMSDLRSQRP